MRQTRRHSYVWVHQDRDSNAVAQSHSSRLLLTSTLLNFTLYALCHFDEMYGQHPECTWSSDTEACFNDVLIQLGICGCI